MWDRSLFRLRSFLLDLGVQLGSWRLSVALMVLAALYQGFLAIWAASAPLGVVGNIAGLLPFWIVYALLLANTGICFWRRLPKLRREIGRGPTLLHSTPAEERPIEPDRSIAEVEQLLRRLGFRPSWRGEGRVGGLRRRWSALGSFLFHGAFFLIAAGFLLTLAARQDARVWVAVGEDYDGRAEQLLSGSPPRIFGAGVPLTPFRLRRVTPEFWADQLLFTNLEAELELPRGRRVTTRINRPVHLAPFTFVRLSGFGHAPRFDLRDRDGRLLDSAFVKLGVFPPGQRDHFTVPEHPHRFHVELLPDHVEEEGVARTRSMNLVAPAILLRVFRGRLDLGGALLPRGEAFEFEGLTIGFPEIRYWAEFTIVSDPGAPTVFLGYVLGILGLLLKLPGRREEAEWTAGEAGSPGMLRTWTAGQGSTPSEPVESAGPTGAPGSAEPAGQARPTGPVGD